MKKYLPVIVLVVLAFGLIYVSKSEKPETNNSLAPNVDTLKITEDDWTYGNKNAKVVLIEYLDFECEACGAYYPITKKIKEEYKDNLLFVVRYLPLPGHKNSKTAAYAVEAAGKQGKFWEMTDILFTKQREWGEQQIANQSQFEKYAIEAGVNIEQWRKDVTSAEVIKRVDDSYLEAMSLQLQGTPSFFVNGQKIEKLNGYESIKTLIDEELKK